MWKRKKKWRVTWRGHGCGTELWNQILIGVGQNMDFYCFEFWFVLLIFLLFCGFLLIFLFFLCCFGVVLLDPTRSDVPYRRQFRTSVRVSR